MKSPSFIRNQIAREWQKTPDRLRLLFGEEKWPRHKRIGKPSARHVNEVTELRRHLEDWSSPPLSGEVIWEELNFKCLNRPISCPVQWEWRDLEDWAGSLPDSERSEYRMLKELLSQTDHVFHKCLARHKNVFLPKGMSLAFEICQLALSLSEGCGEGLPMRALAAGKADTKFMERNKKALTLLLDARFQGRVNNLGLEEFLGCSVGDDNWLLVADLDGSLLPYSQQRIRASELRLKGVPGHSLAVVENAKSLFQLPSLKGCVAVLGLGRNVTWLGAPWASEKRISYWGDLDSWGLSILAQARMLQPSLMPLMMCLKTFESHLTCAVEDSDRDCPKPVEGLVPSEEELFDHLSTLDRGRVEQEYLDKALVHETFLDWSRSH